MLRKSLFWLKERLAHPHLRAVLREMQLNEQLSRDELRHLQQRLISETLRQAAACPYYSRLFAKYEVEVNRPESLSQLPILTKREVNDHLEDLANRSYRGRLRLGTSSGSTGTPGRFYRSHAGLDWGYASGVRCKQWWDLDPAARTLRIWGRGAQFSRSMRARLYLRLCEWKDWAIGVYNICAYDLNTEMVRRQWKMIRKWKPKIIHGYATAVYLLARSVQENGLDGPSLEIGAVIAESEKLFPGQRSQIEEVFACPVLEWYGASECGVIATPCSAGRLHVREDTVHLEIVDGSVVVTTLREHGMPLIRYNLDDQAVLHSEPCPCGMPTVVLKDVHGRACDVIQKADGGLAHGAALFQLMQQFTDVRKFKVVQKALDRFDVYVEPQRSLDPGDRDRIITQFREQFGESVTVRIEELAEIPTEQSGKFRWIVSELELPDRAGTS